MSIKTSEIQTQYSIQKNRVNRIDQKNETNEINQINPINPTNDPNHLNDLNQIDQIDQTNQINRSGTTELPKRSGNFGHFSLTFICERGNLLCVREAEDEEKSHRFTFCGS